jgi:pyridoxamine 5'-phosphate oxidase
MADENLKLASIRREFMFAELDESSVGDDPLSFFQKWFTEAQHAGIGDVNAMTLSTVDSRFMPHARIVLLKGLEDGKFIFYTNYESAKAADMELHPHAALTFYWHELERQVRIEGTVAKVEEHTSDLYFRSRPQGSRLGAWASPQSSVIEHRGVLETNYKKYAERFSDIEIPRPAHWGGYEVSPHLIEFWQGRSNRMHDRILFRNKLNEGWNKCRLAP